MSFVRCALASAAACLLSLAAAAQSGGYRADARNGCKLWLSSPEYYKVVQWDGACKGGLASGNGRFTITSNEGSTISGEAEYAGGKRNGRGYEIYSESGSRTEGLYRDDKLNGRAWKTLSGDFEGQRYEGDFVNDVEQGPGIYTWADGRRLEIQFNAGAIDRPAKYRDAAGRSMNAEMAGNCLYVNARYIESIGVGLGRVCVDPLR